ncbi:signal peptidase II [archaeon D22]|nr:signal peptidase II [archaeon D22]
MVKIKREYLAIVICFVTVVIDQIIKLISRNVSKAYDFILFDFTFVKNTGSAFGMFKNHNLMLTGIAVVFVTVFLFYYRYILKEQYYYAYFLILGGAISNLFDRLYFGYVTDFVSILSFPVFNVADVAISVGGAILVYSIIKEEIIKRLKK